MSIMPQGDLSAYTNPINTPSAVAPVLTIRTELAASRGSAPTRVDDQSATAAAGTGLADIVTFLDAAIAVGATGTVDLGAVSMDVSESIAWALKTEDVSLTGDLATITKAYRAGRFAVRVRVELDGQVAA
ncbi:hypothetical protein ACFW1A_00705 [Kitasatospora sp. NPDC058965]|uniref:hypothetical protein n=1 Tax=Kitasatospora sp. NPDC058965 TaxID=3346682 RepID=UPI003691EF2E